MLVFALACLVHLGRVILYVVHLILYQFQSVIYLILIADFATLVLVLGLSKLWNVEGIHCRTTAKAHALLTDCLIRLVINVHVQSYRALSLVVSLQLQIQWSRYYEIGVTRRLYFLLFRKFVIILHLDSLCFYDLFSISALGFRDHGDVLAVRQVRIGLCWI